MLVGRMCVTIYSEYAHTCVMKPENREIVRRKHMYHQIKSILWLPFLVGTFLFSRLCFKNDLIRSIPGVVFLILMTVLCFGSLFLVSQMSKRFRYSGEKLRQIPKTSIRPLELMWLLGVQNGWYMICSAIRLVMLGCLKFVQKDEKSDPVLVKGDVAPEKLSSLVQLSDANQALLKVVENRSSHEMQLSEVIMLNCMKKPSKKAKVVSAVEEDITHFHSIKTRTAAVLVGVLMGLMVAKVEFAIMYHKDATFLCLLMFIYPIVMMGIAALKDDIVQKVREAYASVVPELIPRPELTAETIGKIGVEKIGLLQQSSIMKALCLYGNIYATEIMRAGNNPPLIRMLEELREEQKRNLARLQAQAQANSSSGCSSCGGCGGGCGGCGGCGD